MITGGKGTDTVDMGDGNDFFSAARTTATTASRAAPASTRSTPSARGRRVDRHPGPARPHPRAVRVRRRGRHGRSRARLGQPAGGHRLRDRARPQRDRDRHGQPPAQHPRPARGHRHRERHAGNDTIKVATTAKTHIVSGLPATVNVQNPERGQKLTIDARDGDDTVDATGLARDTVQPALKGGAGKDMIIGSPSDDLIAGGAGVDVALMGGGLDTFTWARATATTSSRARPGPTSCR